MAILNVLPVSLGHAGIKPRIVYIQTDDTTATVLTSGYLSAATKTFQFSNEDLAVVSVVDSGTTGVGIFEVIVSGSTVSLESPINPGNVTLPVIDDHIAIFDGTTGKIKDDATIAINGGSLQAGLSGTAGYVASFPGTAAKGSLRMTGVANTGDTLTTISNAAMGQASVVSIPDPGAATSEFILADSSVSTQTINTGLSMTGGANNFQTTGGGNFIAGSSGAAGSLFSYPSTASKGSLEIRAIDNTGDTDVIISNAAHGQATTYNINDVGETIGSILVNVLDDADANSNIVTFDVTVGQAALATAGTVTLQASSGTKQYKIRELYLNSGGTNFSGGGGDRLGEVSDGTTSFSILPAANMQALTNARWGDTAVAFPASAAINVSTAAGAALVFQYNAGATDYTAGSLVISGVLERVA